MNNNTYYYKSFDEDVVKSKNQEYKLKNNYVWIKNNIAYRFFSRIMYELARTFGFIYCKFFLQVEIVNKKILKKYNNQGYFIFGNHTQALGDVFLPAICSYKRKYVLADESNLGVAGIGKFLPMIGALPITDSVKGTKELYKAVLTRIKEKKAVVIYPEAHVWPYYTKIRPFDESAFKFPYAADAISFSMTTTYYKKKNKKKPGIRVYIDGPFLIDKSLNKKEAQKKILNEVYEMMNKRAKNSDYEYIKYVLKDENK